MGNYERFLSNFLLLQYNKLNVVSEKNNEFANIVCSSVRLAGESTVTKVDSAHSIWGNYGVKGGYNLKSTHQMLLLM